MNKPIGMHEAKHTTMSRVILLGMVVLAIWTIGMEIYEGKFNIDESEFSWSWDINWDHMIGLIIGWVGVALLFSHMNKHYKIYRIDFKDTRLD